MPRNISVLLAVLTLVAFQPASAASVDRTESAKRFVELLAKEDFAAAEATFDATMKGALPAAKLGQIWQQVNVQAGKFQAQQSARQETADAYVVVLVTCRFEKTALDVKVVYDAEGKVAGLYFLPSQPPGAPWQAPGYCKSGSFEDSAVKVGSGQWELPGTLSVPKGAGPFPAIVLVHGSGPNDRDESIGPNKPFADLACGLASRGVAVLRYEKRTRQHGMKMAGAKELTVREEVIEDALLAVALLRKTERIDAGRVFVLGHSLGGLLAPRIGQGDAAIAGLVMLAGSTRPLGELIREQLTYIASLSGQTPNEAELEKQIEGITKLMPEAYTKDLDAYRPVETAQALKQRMLILQGERDYQVTMADFAGWKAGLEARPDVTFKAYPDLNHLFMTGQGKGTPAEYEKPGHVAEPVIEDIAAWVLR